MALNSGPGVLGVTSFYSFRGKVIECVKICQISVQSGTTWSPRVEAGQSPCQIRKWKGWVGGRQGDRKADKQQEEK